MNEFVNYNAELDNLFDKWIMHYPQEQQQLFCKDGLMRKANGLNVDQLWRNSKRRVAFILKDNPDGWGHDTRTWLTMEKDINRELRTTFIKRLARLFFGLQEANYNVPVNDCYVMDRSKANAVKKTWNEQPFAFIESKKLAGGKTISETTLNQHIDNDKEFLIEELNILKPNIIVCCNHTGDSIFNFVTQKYIGRDPDERYEGDYILDDGSTVPNLNLCLYYYQEEKEKVVVIKSYHPSARAGWKFYEKVFSPYREFLRNHPKF